jgi:chlorite dismutase
MQHEVLPEPLTPSSGWNVVHLFVKATGTVDVDRVRDANVHLEKEGGQVVVASILGHKADACLMGLAEDVWALRRWQTKVAGAGLEVVDSYVSLTEVSEYAAGAPAAMLEARLHPNLPPEGLRSFCFYPMTKRRGETNNWYALDFDDRKALMKAHGVSGRAFAGRILQVITGSTGLDDYEWGVTLFGAHPDDVKSCVYTMRFDEASTLYAEFGPFYVGAVGSLDEVLGAIAR